MCLSPQDLNVSTGNPLYRPGNVISWSDFYSKDSDVINPAVLFGIY